MLVTTRYFIRRGDSPGLVAVRFGCTREDLCDANPGPHVVTDRYGSRGFYSGWFVPGRRINVPIVASGAVGGPSGQVGCGGGCAGGYGMQQFGGAVGASSSDPGWDDPMQTTWPGSILTFYESGIRHEVKRFMGPGEKTPGADAALSVAIMNWLRKWSAPDFFFWLGYQSTPPSHQPCPGLNPPHQPGVELHPWYQMLTYWHPAAQCTFRKAAFYYLEPRPPSSPPRRASATGYGPFKGRLSGPSGNVGGTCSEIEGYPPSQCVDSEYDVNDACIEMSKTVTPYAWQAGHDAGYQDGLRGYAGQYTVPSPPANIPVPYAYTSINDVHNVVDMFTKPAPAHSSVVTRYYCKVQLWNAWKLAYIEGYTEGHARGTQERQATAQGAAQAIAAMGAKARSKQAAQAIAAMGAKARSKQAAQAIAALAPPGRASATGYGPFTGRRG